MPAADRLLMPEALREAFRDPAMVPRAFPVAVEALGREAALALVPDEPGVLKAVARQRAGAGDVAGAAEAWTRQAEAERRERAEELADLESRARMNDLDGVRRGCRGWVARHGAREMDTEDGRRQAARVLELWPSDVEGEWRNDPRGDLVRFFLDGRQTAVKGEALARAVAALLDVPESVRGRVAVLAGLRYEWERLLESTETAGTLDWTSFHVELARAELAEGKPDAARKALLRMSAAARTECSVLLVRREVTRAERRAGLAPGDKETELAAELARSRARVGEVTELSAGGELPVCVDPEEDAGGVLVVRVRAAEPTLVAWGWNGGQATQALATGEVELEAPLAGLQGRAFFTLKVLAGVTPVFDSARMVAAPVSSASASSAWRLQAVAPSSRISEAKPASE